MRQSQVMSLVEAVANVMVGYRLAVLVQIAVFPVFGIAATLKQNLAIGLVFTLVSLGRSYMLRRLFENGLPAGLTTVSHPSEQTAHADSHDRPLPHSGLGRVAEGALARCAGEDSAEEAESVGPAPGRCEVQP